MYISKYFATQNLIAELNTSATVHAIDSVSNSREDSLSIMRKEMLSNNSATALICLGGKTNMENVKPGIDEEIEIAISQGIPVFLIGSVGGRSSVLAHKYNKDGWCNKLNKLTVNDNIELMTSTDFGTLAHKILNSLACK